MSYQILPNILFILAVLGIILIILRRLPEATKAESLEQESFKMPVEEKLKAKGLPTVTISKIKSFLTFRIGKLWQFMLEAKDLKPGFKGNYQIRKLFKFTKQTQKANESQKPENPEIIAKPVMDEAYFLEAIKKEPKNLAHYESLGKLYQEQRNFTDSRDIFLYLVKHDSDNSEYHAKLAYACYQLKEYETSINHYQKSLALDSSHPNRYYNLGLGLKHLKRYAESRLALQKAVEMESGNAKYKEALASLKK